MSSRILLVNFGYLEKHRISKLGLEAHLGFLSDAWNESSYSKPGKKMVSQGASFYSPLSLYEYKVIFIRLIKEPPLFNEYSDKASTIDSQQIKIFFRYWYELDGLLVIFADDSNYTDLGVLGFPLASLENSIGSDRTVHSYNQKEGKEPKRTLKELKSSIKMPPTKYIIVQKSESEYSDSRHWRIFTPYINNNKDKLGIFLDWGFSYEQADKPQLFVLPPFKDYGFAIENIIRSLARIHARQLPEVIDSDWTIDDRYFPKEVGHIENEKKEISATFKSNLNLLEEKKRHLKDKYSNLIDLLTTSGDELKDAVITTLSVVFGLKVIDLDQTRKSDFREDIMIQDEKTGKILFAELKGTRNANPTLAYIVQLQKNLLKRGDKDAIGALILNHDLTREPDSRPKAYVGPDDEEAIKDIVYIDTRVIFNLALAIIDHGLPASEARDLIFDKGRVTFDIKEYLSRMENE